MNLRVSSAFFLSRKVLDDLLAVLIVSKDSKPTTTIAPYEFISRTKFFFSFLFPNLPHVRPRRDLGGLSKAIAEGSFWKEHTRCHGHGFGTSDLLERKGEKEKKSWTWKRGSCGISSCHDSAISAPTKEFAFVSLAVSATEKDPASENPAYFVAGDTTRDDHRKRPKGPCGWWDLDPVNVDQILVVASLGISR